MVMYVQSWVASSLYEILFWLSKNGSHTLFLCDLFHAGWPFHEHISCNILYKVFYTAVDLKLSQKPGHEQVLVCTCFAGSSYLALPAQQPFTMRQQGASLWDHHKQKRKESHTFWRQFNEKPSIITGCPVRSSQIQTHYQRYKTAASSWDEHVCVRQTNRLTDYQTNRLTY